jgi:hypothetical protein
MDELSQKMVKAQQKKTDERNPLNERAIHARGNLEP